MNENCISFFDKRKGLKVFLSLLKALIQIENSEILYNCKKQQIARTICPVDLQFKLIALEKGNSQYVGFSSLAWAVGNSSATYVANYQLNLRLLRTTSFETWTGHMMHQGEIIPIKMKMKLFPRIAGYGIDADGKFTISARDFTEIPL